MAQFTGLDLDAASPSLGREWIEIEMSSEELENDIGLPPWGGSGLKCFEVSCMYIQVKRLPPWGGSGLKWQYSLWHRHDRLRLPPWGGSGLKCAISTVVEVSAVVSLLGEGVD